MGIGRLSLRRSSRDPWTRIGEYWPRIAPIKRISIRSIRATRGLVPSGNNFAVHKCHDGADLLDFGVRHRRPSCVRGPRPRQVQNSRSEGIQDEQARSIRIETPLLKLGGVARRRFISRAGVVPKSGTTPSAPFEKVASQHLLTAQPPLLT